MTRARGPRRPERADAPRPAASGEVPAACPRSRTPALLLRRGPVSRHAKTNSNRPSTYVKTVESRNSENIGVSFQDPRSGWLLFYRAPEARTTQDKNG